MTPGEYLKDLVDPAGADFEQNPTSIRHAYAACMFAYHFADAVVAHQGKAGVKHELGRVRAEIATISDAYRVVEGVANLAKHVELRVKKDFMPTTKDTHVGSEAAWTDGSFWLEDDGSSVSWSDAEDVVRTRDDQGKPIDLLWCVQNVSQALHAYTRMHSLP